jgi:hypothetical protein
MIAGELIELLKTVPNDATIIIWDRGLSQYGDDVKTEYDKGENEVIIDNYFKPAHDHS